MLICPSDIRSGSKISGLLSCSAVTCFFLKIGRFGPYYLHPSSFINMYSQIAEKIKEMLIEYFNRTSARPNVDTLPSRKFASLSKVEML